MAAGPTKRSSRPRSSAKPRRQSASAKPAPRSTAAIPSRQRKTQAGKKATPKRTHAAAARNVAGARGAGQTDATVAALLETIAQGIGRIDEVHAELVNLRTVVEELIQTVSVLVADSEAQEREAATGTDDVVIVETYGVSADEEEPEPQGAAQD
jgi:hypothetical protein